MGRGGCSGRAFRQLTFRQLAARLEGARAPKSPRRGSLDGAFGAAGRSRGAPARHTAALDASLSGIDQLRARHGGRPSGSDAVPADAGCAADAGAGRSASSRARPAAARRLAVDGYSAGPGPVDAMADAASAACRGMGLAGPARAARAARTAGLAPRLGACDAASCTDATRGGGSGRALASREPPVAEVTDSVLARSK